MTNHKQISKYKLPFFILKIGYSLEIEFYLFFGFWDLVIVWKLGFVDWDLSNIQALNYAMIPKNLLEKAGDL